jgi:hypothetical protein
VPDELHERVFTRQPPGWPDDDLAKGAAHKYIKRVPTGKAKPKYRYWYRVPGRKGLVESSDLAAGSKFRATHQGRTGHFEVHEHHKEKGVVTVKHDESGRTVHLKEKDLHKLVQRHVAEKTVVAKKKPTKKKPVAKKKAVKRKTSKELPPAPALKTGSLNDLGKGGYDSIEGFSTDRKELENQAHHGGKKDREYMVIPQAGGFALASKKKGLAEGPEAVGEATKVFMRGGEGGRGIQASEAEYVVMEAKDVVASHDPKSFNERKEYPEGVQERRYHEIKDEQLKIDRIARTLEPAIVLNSNPDAINGTPVVTEDGVVLGGNGRTMGMQRAYALYPEQGKALKSYLSQHARAFGVSSAEIERMKEPLLVRRMKAGKDTEQLRKLGRRMNEALTQGLDPRSAEVALGKNYVSQSVLDSLAQQMEPEESLSDFLRSSRARPFVSTIQQSGIIDEFNRAEFIDQETGQLNEDGRLRVERVLAARMIPDASLLSRMGMQLRGNIAKAMPYLIRAENAGWDLRESFKKAVSADLEMRAHNLKPSTVGRKNYLSQMEIGGAEGFAAAIRKDPIAGALLEVVQDHNKPRKFPQGFKQFALEAAQQEFDHGANVSMFAMPKVEPHEALGTAFGLKSERQGEMFAASMSSQENWGHSLLKSDEGKEELGRYTMWTVNHELEHLVRQAIQAASIDKKAVDGKSILSKLSAFVVEQARRDKNFARGMGVRPLTIKVLQGMLSAHIKANVADIAIKLVKSQLIKNNLEKVKCLQML